TFLKMYVLKLGFLDGREGLLLSALSGYYVLVKYLKLWESGLTPRP
ncbi:MAG TPA: glycosyltransferase family 2 protein, partial [Candidatus Edwardsbacteria bacterium]|nr:glycosyltransferase family 2 protein [Candidatus Edwardsbacteria bacterium]